MKSFIPKRVNNKVVVGFLSFAKTVGKPFNRKNKIGRDAMLESISRHFASFDKTGGFIEDQDSYKDVPYGGKSIWYAGCGVIATYNALHSMGRICEWSGSLFDRSASENCTSEDVSVKVASEAFLDLIREFEKTGIVFSGNLGTAPLPIKKYFDRRGYRTGIAYKASDFDRLGAEYDVLILTAYMDGSDITKSVHHICITKKNGLFTAHNVYCNGYLSKPEKSVSKVIESINNGRAKGICLIGIMCYN